MNDREKLDMALDALAKIAAGTWNRKAHPPQDLREYAAATLRKLNQESPDGNS